MSTIYDEIRQEDNTVIQQKRNYTLLAVSDDTYRSEGVTSVADLAAKVGAIGTDYKDKANELFRYVAYHVIGGSYSVLISTILVEVQLHDCGLPKQMQYWKHLCRVAISCILIIKEKLMVNR